MFVLYIKYNRYRRNYQGNDAIAKHPKYNNLIELISNCVRLNWDGKALTLFETDVLMKYLTSVEPVKFKNKLSMLQVEVKEKETKDEIPF